MIVNQLFVLFHSKLIISKMTVFDLVPDRFLKCLPPLTARMIRYKKEGLTREEITMMEFKNSTNPDARFRNEINLERRAAIGLSLSLPAPKDHTPIQRAHESLWKEYALLKALTINKSKQDFKSIYNKAKQYEITELAYLSASMIRMQGGMNNKRVFFEECESAFSLMQYEELAERLYIETIICIGKGKVDQSVLLENINQLKPHSVKSSKINYYYHYILTTYLTYKKEYDKVINATKECFEYLSSKPSLSSYKVQMLFTRINVLLSTSQAHLAKQSAIEATTYFKSGPTWSMCHAFRAISCFHTGEYEEAYYIYKENEKTIKTLASHHRDIWEITQAYAYILYKSGLSDQKVSFRINKFLNSVSIDDKQTINLNVIIIKLLNAKKGEIIDYQEGLKKYISRYLKKGTRKHAILTLFSNMVDCEFRFDRFLHRNKKLIELLDQNTDEVLSEFLPFKVVFELMQSKLTGRKKRVATEVVKVSK